MLDKHVNDLIHGGFAVVPSNHHGISVNLIEEATVANQTLIRTMVASEFEAGFSRKNEGNDKDIGLIYRDKNRGKDVKYFLHYTHELMGYISQRKGLAVELAPHLPALLVLDRLYWEVNQFVAKMLNGVEWELGNKLHHKARSLSRLFNQSCQNSFPYGTTVLRGLWYEALPNPTGARPHLDRSFPTTHFGDLGGELFVHPEYGFDGCYPISPDKGCVLVFWGVRAPIISGGILKPMLHSATANPNEDRQAMVHFGNIPWPQVSEWEKGVDMFCDLHRVDNFADYYNRVWQM